MSPANPANPAQPTTPSAPRGRTTIETVARRVGVSKAVVSTLLNGQADGPVRVSPSTREQVLAAARELRYQPRDAASHLRLYPEQGHYCVLIARPAMAGFDQYYVEVLRGLVEALDGAPLNINLATYDVDVDYLAEPGRLPFVVENGWTSKYVFMGPPNYSLVLALQERGFAVLYLSRQLDARGIGSAAPDYEAAGELGVRRLLEAGHRRVALAAEHYFRHGNMDFHVRRLRAGAARALRAFGLADDHAPLVFSAEANQDRPPSFGADLLAAPDRPTGVFCFCDYTASRLLRAATDYGLKVPDDLSVVGCNDQPVARDTSPPLTTVRFPLRELGATAVRHFRRLDAGETIDNPHYIVPVSLIERQSVRAI
jgi:LacI family transcriptional regulator